MKNKIVLCCLALTSMVRATIYNVTPLEGFEGIRHVTQPKSELRKGCDLIYADNVSFILSSMRSVTTNPPSEADLKEYEAFMNATKMYNDLGLKLQAFEQQLTADIRDILRKPLTEYSRCYTKRATNVGVSFQTIGPSAALLAPCDGAYAVHMQEALNMLRGLVSEQELKYFEDYMINLKTYQDLDFQIKEFEKKTDGRVMSRLRMPLQKYDTCRDSLIRLANSGPIFPR